jgi:hypothetical protein
VEKAIASYVVLLGERWNQRIACPVNLALIAPDASFVAIDLGRFEVYCGPWDPSDVKSLRTS